MNKGKKICTDLQDLASSFYLNLGLTGGYLYKGGKRKDIDIIVYPHNCRENDSQEKQDANFEAFLIALVKDNGEIVFRNNWLTKINAAKGNKIDLFRMGRHGGNTYGLDPKNAHHFYTGEC